MANVTERRCNTCAFYDTRHLSPHGLGKCRRFAPDPERGGPYTGEGDGSGVASWSRVHPVNDTCGDWVGNSQWPRFVEVSNAQLGGTNVLIGVKEDGTVWSKTTLAGAWVLVP